MVFIVEFEFMSCHILGAGDPPRACQAQIPACFLFVCFRSCFFSSVLLERGKTRTACFYH